MHAKTYDDKKKKMASHGVFLFDTAGYTSQGGACGAIPSSLASICFSFFFFFSILLDFHALPFKISQQPFDLFFL